MTPLAQELHRILTDEAGRPPLSLDGLARVLHALGHTVQDGEIEAALESLMAAGHVEAVHSARLGRRFRVQRHDRGDMSAPAPPKDGASIGAVPRRAPAPASRPLSAFSADVCTPPPDRADAPRQGEGES